MGAFEVEEIEATREVLGDDVVLGEIKEIAKHSDADKLQVTQTEISPGEISQIVCGASNIKVGQKIPVALVGSTVTNRKDGSELKIKKSKIRGVESCGMLCSSGELGFSEEEVNAIEKLQGDGIYLLADPSDEKIKDQASQYKVGTPIKTVLDLDTDYVLEVGARSNRGDALSVLGQARELSALLAKDLKVSEPIDIQNHELINYDESIKSIEPKISNPEDCELFYTVALENVKVQDSPQWLKDRLNAMGTKSINIVVDVSNYVLHELGQPMHFYDRDKLSGNYIEARRAKPGEKILTLEEKTHELEEINHVIADDKEPVCLAGVMGGLNHSINDETKNVIIECAVFNPALTRKSSRAAGVESESKRRYERGVDKAGTYRAVLRALDLLANYARAEEKLSVGKILQAGSAEVPEQIISLPMSQVERHLGISIDATEIISLLEKLEIRSTAVEEGSLSFSIPSFRQMDITRDIDLIEEIGRLYGFDKIPPSCPSTFVGVDIKQEASQIRELVLDTFASQGYSQAILSSLIGDSLESLDNQIDSSQIIEMDNPLSREHRYLRRSLIPALVQAASRNYSYDKSTDIKLFELGKAYKFTGETEAADISKCLEAPKLAAIFVKNQKDWTQAKPKTFAESFYELKSNVEKLYPRARFIPFEPGIDQDLFHPGVSAQIENAKKTIGVIAKLHPSTSKKWDLPDETYVLELAMPQLQKIKFKKISSTPIIERDITVDSKEDVLAQDISAFIEKTIKKDFKGSRLVSFFKRPAADGSFQIGSKSTSFRLRWQSPTETLNGEEIDTEIDKLKGLLEKELGVTFR